MRRIRRGMTLIETQVIIMISAMLISGTGLCLHGVYRAQHRLQGNLQRQASLDRLILQFRADAHIARAAVLSDTADGGLKLVLSDTSEVLYENIATGVSRTVISSDSVEHQDAFRLPGSAPVVWTVHNERAVVMQIDPSEERVDGSQTAALTVEATINIHKVLSSDDSDA